MFETAQILRNSLRIIKDRMSFFPPYLLRDCKNEYKIYFFLIKKMQKDLQTQKKVLPLHSQSGNESKT